MIRTLLSLVIAAFALASCSSEPTLQKYFVEKAEQQDFVALDVAPGLMIGDSTKLNSEEQKALESVKNVNILMFKAHTGNVATFEKEKSDVKSLLKTDSYDELIKINTPEVSASINTKGKDEHIEEFVVFMQQPDKGFGVIRVTGEDMTPNNVMTIAGLLQKTNLQTEQLEPLKQLFKK